MSETAQKLSKAMETAREGPNSALVKMALQYHVPITKCQETNQVSTLTLVKGRGSLQLETMGPLRALAMMVNRFHKEMGSGCRRVS